MQVTDCQGKTIEGYSFVKANARVDVLWSRDATPDTIWVSRYALLQVYDRDGNVIYPPLYGERYRVTVGFSPVYLELVR